MAPRVILALDHVALRLPNIGEAASWYERVYGLRVTERLPGEIRLVSRPGRSVVAPRQELTLLEGAGPAVDHVAFQVSEAADLTTLAEHARARGAAVRGPAVFESGMGPSLRMQDPAGGRIEVCVPGSPQRRPAGDAPFAIARLGHFTATAPEPLDVARFYEDVLGFRLSDQFGGNFVWLRCNRDHHAFACARDRAGMQHFAYEVEGWEALEGVCDQLLKEGARVEFGPGRHGPGDNVFLYVLDPFGFRAEFFCELERIDDDEARKPVDWGADVRPRTANRWGPPAPSSFLKDQACVPVVADDAWLRELR